MKARNDVPYNETQRINIFKLTDATVAAKREVAERLDKLVSAGTDPVKDLVAAKADLCRRKFRAKKDKHECKTNVDNAKGRTLATLERQLFQAGIDPGTAGTKHLDHGHRRGGDSGGAGRPGPPGRSLHGRVLRLSGETIRRHRGERLAHYFQGVGVRSASSSRYTIARGSCGPACTPTWRLSTNARDTLLIPADGVLHVGQFDYVLVADGENQWKVVQVKTGEQFGSFLEILSGLQPGDRVIGAGAILLSLTSWPTSRPPPTRCSARVPGAPACGSRVGSGGAKPSGSAAPP